MYASFNARAVGLSLPTHETIALAAQAGFRGVDLMVRDALEAGDDFKVLRARMDDLGLRAGAFPLPMNWRGDEAAFEEGVRKLPTYARAAADLGLIRTATWVMPEWVAEDHDPRISAREFHVRRLGKIAKILDDHGVRLGLEVIGVDSSRSGRGLPFVHRLADVEPLRAQIEAEAGVPVGILADSWHLYAAGEPAETVLGWEARQIVWVHVADVAVHDPADRHLLRDDKRGLPGETGRVESRRLLEILQSRGYDGPVTAEPLTKCHALAGLDPARVAHATFKAIQSVWP